MKYILQYKAVSKASVLRGLKGYRLLQYSYSRSYSNVWRFTGESRLQGGFKIPAVAYGGDFEPPL